MSDKISAVCPMSVSTSHCTLCPLFVSTSHCTVCPLSVSTSHCTVCLLSVPHTAHCVHCLSVLHTVQSVYCLSVSHTAHSVHCLSVLHTVHSAHCLTVPHTVQSVSTSHCTLCPLSVSTSHSICSPSPHCQLHCCSNTLCCFTVTALSNVTLISVKVCVTCVGYLLLADQSFVYIIWILFFKGRFFFGGDQNSLVLEVNYRRLQDIHPLVYNGKAW